MAGTRVETEGRDVEGDGTALDLLQGMLAPRASPTFRFAQGPGGSWQAKEQSTTYARYLLVKGVKSQAALLKDSGNRTNPLGGPSLDG